MDTVRQGRLTGFIILFLTTAAAAARPAAVLPPPAVREARTRALFARLPLTFEPNRGQAARPVKFLSRGSGYGLFLLPTEAVLVLGSREPAAKTPGRRGRQSVLRMKLAGANPQARMEGDGRLPGQVHYFLGNDPNAWRTHLPTFRQVRCHDVYPGIDLVYYGSQEKLEYDMVVAPGARPASIALDFPGVRRLRIEPDGALALETAGGAVRQSPPRAYQEAEGGRRTVESRYVRLDARRVGIQVGAYDAARPLVIDPVLAYSTFLGGGGIDSAMSIRVDSAGAALVAGPTNSTNFPTTNGSVDPSANGQYDVFVAKIAPDGRSLLFATYLGGSQDEGRDFERRPAAALGVDGSVFVTGQTTSRDFPTTQGAYMASNDVGAPRQTEGIDAFVTKLDSTGSRLVYSTFLGGTGVDVGSDIAVAPGGKAVVTGWTSAARFRDARDFPTTAAAWAQHAPNPIGGTFAFVTELNADGSDLVYSSFYGGTPNQPNSTSFSQAYAVAADAQGGLYITGHGVDQNWPTTPNNIPNNSESGAFVAKFDPTRSGAASLVYSVNVSGVSKSWGWDVAVDGAGSAFVTGFTESADLPTTPDAFQRAKVGAPGIGEDGFVARLNVAGTDLVYCTYLGGMGGEEGRGIAVDGAGNAYITGDTNSGDFPLRNPLSAPAPGTTRKVFVTCLNAHGSGLLYSTFLGGSSHDTGLAIAVDAAGSAYIAGETRSQDFPVVNAAQPAHGGGPSPSQLFDGFVARIAPDPPAAPTGLQARALSESQIALNWSAGSDNALVYRISRRKEGGAYSPLTEVTADNTIYTDDGLDPNTRYFYQVRAANGGGESPPSAEAAALTFPSAPAGLTARVVSQTRIDLEWRDTNPTPAASLVERSTDGGVTFATIAGTPAGTTTYSDAGLTADTTYRYRVKATNASGESGYSDVAVATTLPNPPRAPLGVSVTVVSFSQLTLNWTASPGAAGYKIERRTADTGYVSLPNQGAGATSYEDKGLSPETRYTYRLRAFNAGGESDYSDEASGTTPPQPPDVPSGLAVHADSTSQLTVTWNAAPRAMSYILERKSGDGDFSPLPAFGADATRYVDTGLAANTVYTYRIRARGNGGDSDRSQPMSGRTLPVAPVGLRITRVEQTRIDLAWTDPNPGSAATKLERSEDQGATYTPVATVPPGVAFYRDTGVQAGKSYRYRAKSTNDSGDSGYSETADARTPPNPPGRPSGLVVTPVSPSELKLTWTAVAGATGYRIERKDGDHFITVGTTGADTPSFTNGGLSPSTTYTYRVFAANEGGESEPSDQANGTTPAVPPVLPDAPGELTATAASSIEIRLSWADRSGNESGFKIQRKKGDGSFEDVGSVGPNVTTWSNTGLTPGTRYTYRVYAWNSAGNSGFSNEAAAETPGTGGTPGRLRVTPTAVSFGIVAAGRTVSRTVRLQNTGRGTLAVTVSTPDAPFRVTRGAGSFTLRPGASRMVVVAFMPARSGASTGGLAITSNDPEHPTVTVRLSGRGIGRR